jgi:hypothetical protein
MCYLFRRLLGVISDDGSSCRCVVCCLEFLELLRTMVAAVAVLFVAYTFLELLRRMVAVLAVLFVAQTFWSYFGRW